MKGNTPGLKVNLLKNWGMELEFILLQNLELQCKLELQKKLLILCQCFYILLRIKKKKEELLGYGQATKS